MSFFPPELHLEGKMYKAVFVEAIWNIGAGAVGQAKGFIGDLLLVAASLKIFGWERFWFIVPISGALYCIGVFLFGLFLYRKNVVMRRGNIVNCMGNPQVMDIIERLERIERRMEKKDIAP